MAYGKAVQDMKWYVVDLDSINISGIPIAKAGPFEAEDSERAQQALKSRREAEPDHQFQLVRRNVAKFAPAMEPIKE